MAGAFLAVKKGGCPLSAGLREGHAPPLHAFRQRPATREGRMPARRKTHCRGGFHIRPGRGAAGLPGTMRASSPTGGCYNTEVVISRLAAGLPWIVGEGFIPPAGVRGAAGLPGTMRASSPTGVCYNTEVVFSRLAAGPPWVVGEGHGPPVGVRGGAGCGGIRASRPTVIL